MRPSYRPYYASCLPVRPSVCLSHKGSQLKKRNAEKSKLTQMFPTVQVSGVPILRSKGQRSRSQDVKPSKSGVMFTYGRQCWRIKRSRHRLHTRPTPLLGLLYCRRLRPWATGLTATYNVSADISLLITRGFPDKKVPLLFL